MICVDKYIKILAKQKFGAVVVYSCLIIVLTGILLTPPPSLAAPKNSAFLSRWWSPDSFWNVPIADSAHDITNVRVMPYSTKAIETYLAYKQPMNMNWDSAGVAVIYADGKTEPQADIIFTNYPGWGWIFPNVPQGPELIAAIRYRLDQKNTDGMTCLYNENLKGFYSFWNPILKPDGQTISITTGSFNPIEGPGGSAINQFTPSGGRVAGTSYCGGLIRPYEIHAGRIDHALALVWPSNLNFSYEAAKKDGKRAFVYPANHTDGTAANTDGTLPKGSRFQLDPTLTEDQLRALGLTTPADFVIARALQVYGAYLVDSNTPRSNAGLYFQSGYGKGASIYKATNPWPLSIVSKLRIIAGPEPAQLDTVETVGIPIRIK